MRLSAPRSALACFAAVCVLISTTCGCVRTRDGRQTPSRSASPLPGSQNAGRINRHDLLRVSIYGLVEGRVYAVREARVDSEGMVRLPYRRRVRVLGMTRSEAEQAIARSYGHVEIDRAYLSVELLEVGADATVPPGPVMPGDLLKVVLADYFGNTDATRMVRVGADGRVGLPSLTINLKGLVESQAEEAIETAYRLEVGVIEPVQASVLRVKSAERPSVTLGPIQPGDLLQITLPGVLVPGDDDPLLLRVADDGTVGLPIVGGTKLAGASELDAQELIQKAYSQAGLVERVQTTVLRVESADRSSARGGALRPGDLVHVVVTDYPDPQVRTVKLARIDGDGRITVPGAGSIKLMGLSETEAQAAIMRAIDAAMPESDSDVPAPVTLLRVECGSDESVNAPDRPIAPLPEIVSTYLRSLELPQRSD